MKMWNPKSYLAMKTDVVDEATQLISYDFMDLGLDAHNLAIHVFSGSGITLLQFIASIAAIYLLILDHTNWKTNILTSLLIPYIFFSLPSCIFSVFREEVGKWIGVIAVLLRLFIPKHFPAWLELPSALVLLIVVAPDLFASTFRSIDVGVAEVCLVIACYLLQEHIRASGGFRNSFTKATGISNTIGIILLLVYPIWALVVYTV